MADFLKDMKIKQFHTVHKFSPQFGFCITTVIMALYKAVL